MKTKDAANKLITWWNYQAPGYGTTNRELLIAVALSGIMVLIIVAILMAQFPTEIEAKVDSVEVGV